jgi:hypothetical protein
MRKLLAISLFLLACSGPAYAGRTWTIEPQTPDLTRPIGEAGSISNPYTITERRDGSLEIKTNLPDLNSGRIMEPGSPTNPIIIRPNRY